MRAVLLLLLPFAASACGTWTAFSRVAHLELAEGSKARDRHRHHRRAPRDCPQGLEVEVRGQRYPMDRGGHLSPEGEAALLDLLVRTGGVVRVHGPLDTVDFRVTDHERCTWAHAQEAPFANELCESVGASVWLWPARPLHGYLALPSGRSVARPARHLLAGRDSGAARAARV